MGVLNPFPAVGHPACRGRLHWDRDGWLHVCPCPLFLSVPRGGGTGDRGTAAPTLCGQRQNSPHPSALCHTGQGHHSGVCTGDIPGDMGLPKHPIGCVLGVPPPSAAAPETSGVGGGLCLHPGLCPPAPALPQLLEIFPIENPAGLKTFPRGKRGLIPQGNAGHQSCTFQAGSWGTSRALVPAPPNGHSQGVPHAGGQRGRQQPEQRLVPSWDVPWRCRWKPPLSRNEEGRAGNWLRPPDLPVLQRLRVAVGQQPPLQQNIYPSGTEPWTSLPPARHHAAKLGKTRLWVANPGSGWQILALGGKCWLWVANLGSGRQSPALSDKVQLWRTNLGSA